MKKVLILAVMTVMVLGFSMQADAALQTIGTATYNSSDYNLIYDNDLNITWLDYSNPENDWYTQMGWAAGLNGAGVVTYNFNPGVTMTWSDDWRLPTAEIVDADPEWSYDGTAQSGFNITTSEMGHLFYTELGNNGMYDTEGNRTGCGDSFGIELIEPSCLTNTGDFQNLEGGWYKSGTVLEAGSDRALDFSFRMGNQVNGLMDSHEYAIAVRDGLAVVPEPISSMLFLVGGAVLGFRRFRMRR